MRLLYVLASLIAIGYSPIFSQSQDIQGLDAYIMKAMETWQVPGLAIAIVNADSIVYAQGYGLRNLQDSLAVNPNTIFAVASNTKAITATAMGLLVQKGQIDWDDKVLDYLPDFQLYDPIATRKLTIRDLFCHRVGHATWGGDLTWFGSRYDREEVVQRIRYQEPIYDFRTGYGYSNLMYLVAGQVIEAVTGQSWDAFVSSRIFAPLEMPRSSTTIRGLDQMDNVASPHSYRLGKVFPVAYRNVDNIAPAAGINSSVIEMGHWLQLQLSMGIFKDRAIVNPSILEETRTSHTLLQLSESFKKLFPTTHFRTYGLGWGMMDYEGKLLIQHTGGMDGMYSYTGFMPEMNVGIVVLSNRDNHNLMNAIPMHIYDKILDMPFQDWSQIYYDRFVAAETIKKEKADAMAQAGAWSQPTLSVQQYLGKYESRIYGKAEIVSIGDSMRIRMLAHPDITGYMEHWEQDVWLAKWSDPVWHQSFIRFDLENGTKVKQFRLQVRPDWIDPLEYQFIRR